MGILPPSPQPSQPEGAAAFVTMPGKEKRAFVKQLLSQSLPLPALVNAPAEGSPENSLSALFRAEKVRLFVTLARLRDSDHWSLAKDLHREERKGMGNTGPFDT